MLALAVARCGRALWSHACLRTPASLSSFRTLPTSAAASAGAVTKDSTVSQFATVRISSSIPVHVQSLEPARRPSALKEDASVDDRTRVHIELKPDRSMHGGLTQDDLCIDHEGENLVVKCHRQGATLNVWVPFSCGVDAELKEADESSSPADLIVSKMEGGAISFKTGRGSCFLAGVKTSAVNGTSDAGNLVIDSLLGNVSYQSTTGSVFVRRVQSQEFDVELASGTASVEALYSDVTRVATESGHISVGDAHGPGSYRSDTGDITLGTVDGPMDVWTRTGNVFMHVARAVNGTVNSDSGIDNTEQMNPRESERLKWPEVLYCTRPHTRRGVHPNDATATTTTSNGSNGTGRPLATTALELRRKSGGKHDGRHGEIELQVGRAITEDVPHTGTITVTHAPGKLAVSCESYMQAVMGKRRSIITNMRAAWPQPSRT
ncbi:hypothetical protein PTSG_01214 [Salpingoeca rosetta]|uniref:DUF4097 domain-containing protein n=1 Tax=Salpingoeca rosetta (strain ATCC 50818 / BSB-021) TaxID=946362 RepID=F2U152_SALR5|nr:uncharacterized protein PTSG_01214 [Salpingoeca rosetta]EGD80626.1 hypothetical protein PTSG_01214 [Salpingoeca rosetta]|eukprot:XP_004997187.1 hypothetical protein PTSG_01214 [Salpingoeca rosetta]